MRFGSAPSTKRNVASLMVLFLLLASLSVLGFWVRPIRATEILVPDDYPSIQEAINAAASGDMIHIKAGTYPGQIVINKTVSLVGENRDSTIIEEETETEDVVIVAANSVLISNLTIRGYKEPEPTPPPSYWVSGSGILIEGYNNTSIVNVDLTNGGNARGILITDAYNTTLVGNSIVGNIYGVILRDCSGINLTNNVVNDNWGYTGWSSVRSGQGIYLDDCYNATMRGNRMRENGDDFCISGQELSHFLHDIDTSNLLINGTTRKMYYLVNQHDMTINATGYPDLGFLALVNSTGIDVEGFDLVDNTPGLLLAYTNDTLVRNNTMRYCTQGITLIHSSNNTISDNTFAPNNTGSISIQYHSTENTIAYNEIQDNTGQAMYITNSSRNMIARNNMTDNGDGIYMYYSDENTLDANNVTNNGEGIFMSYSSNNALTENTMNNNTINFRVIAYFDTQLSQFTHAVDPSNLVDGKHIYYLINYTGTTVDPSTCPDAGFVALVNSSGTTIQDLQLQGMLLGYTNQTLVQRNTLVDGGDSITMVKSSGNHVTQNDATDDFDGIMLYDYSQNNVITHNNVTDVGSDGISLRWHSANNTITENTLVDNGGSGIRVDDYSNNTVVTRNIALNNSWCGIDVGYYCDFNVIAGNNATGNGNDGISLSYNWNCTVTGNTVAGNSYDGIRLDDSANNTISANALRDNGHAGIALRYDSSNNTITGNDIRNSTMYGIQFYILPVNDTVVGNSIVDSGQDGINIEWSSYHFIAWNNITNSANDGIHIEGYHYEELPEVASVHNLIVWNNVALSGGSGIYLYASNNTIHHNRFVNNAHSITVDPQSTNILDDGYPSGGNYWSDYTDTDIYSGQYQNITGSDDIWDHPYSINANNTDRYPFTELHDIDPPEIGVPTRTPSGDVLPNQQVTIAVNVTDNLSGVMNVTLYYTIDDGLNWNSTAMAKNPATELYEAVIPGQEYGTTVRFKIRAFDYAGNNQTRNGMQAYCIYQVVPESPLPIALATLITATLLLAIIRKKKEP